MAASDQAQSTFPIKISSIGPNGTLVLADDTRTRNGVTTASKGDTIQWIFDSNSGVKSINEIHLEGNDSIFIAPPSKLPGGSPIWSGTIRTDANTPKEQDYCIYYINQSDQLIKSDPKIQVNS
jgi:hypothetical protein